MSNLRQKSITLIVILNVGFPALIREISHLRNLILLSLHFIAYYYWDALLCKGEFLSPFLPSSSLLCIVPQPVLTLLTTAIVSAVQRYQITRGDASSLTGLADSPRQGKWS